MDEITPIPGQDDEPRVHEEAGTEEEVCSQAAVDIMHFMTPNSDAMPLSIP